MLWLFMIALCVGGCVVMFGSCLCFARLFCFRARVCLFGLVIMPAGIGWCSRSFD